MKQFSINLWQWIKKHKAISISVASLLVIAISLGIAIPALSDLFVFSTTKGITRDEWTQQLAATFGYQNYGQETPYFPDVTEDSNIFAAVQTMAENGIVEIGGNYEPDKILSGYEMLLEATRAYDETYIAKRLNVKTPSDQQMVNYVISLDDSLEKYNDSKKGLSLEDAVALIEKVHTLYMNREFQNFSDIKIKGGVTKLPEGTVYTTDGIAYTVESENPIQVGDIIFLPCSEADWDGQTIVVESVTANGDSYTISGPQPEFTEIIESFDMEFSQEAAFENFVPAEGVTITIEDDGSGMEVSYHSEDASGKATTLASFDENIKIPSIGGSWKSDGKLKISPYYKEVADFLENSGLSMDESYKGPKSMVLNEDGELCGKYDSGYECVVNLKITELFVKGYATYNPKAKYPIKFSVNTGANIDQSFSIKGNIKKSFLLGSTFIPTDPFGLTGIKMDVYVETNLKGELTLSTKISASVEVSKKTNKITATQKIKKYDDFSADCELKIYAGLDPVICIGGGFQVADAYALIGIGAEMQWDSKNPRKIDFTLFLPLIKAGTGYNPKTVASQAFNLNMEINIMDSSGAIYECPFIKTYTFEFPQISGKDEAANTESSDATTDTSTDSETQNTDSTENTSTRNPSSGDMTNTTNSETPNTDSNKTSDSNETSSTHDSNESEKQRALAQAKEKADQDLYLEAIKILKGYLQLETDYEVKEKLTQYTEKYVDQQIKLAEKLFLNPSEDYIKALNIVNAALQNANDSKLLLTKKEYYQSFAPVYLADIEPYDRTYWFKTLDTVNDVFGTSHRKCLRVAKDFTSASGTYDLNRNYNKLSFTVFGLGDGDYGSLKIYLDNVCVYSNTNIDVNTRPFTVELDVTGALDLKFEMYQVSNDVLLECYGLADVFVQKTAK